MITVNSLSKVVTFTIRRSHRPASLVHRTLYSPAVLGVDNYVHTRERIKQQFVNVEEKFKMKMSDFSSSESSSMIFTEDLKHVIHLIEGSEEDLNLARRMMQKFCKQNKDLRFGSFIFGPIVMRMYHYLNKPQDAFEVFTDPEMDGFFDQLISFQLLMDLLFKNGMYKEVIETFNIIQKKQVQGFQYPKNAVVLVLAACYKMNNEESFKYASRLWSSLTKAGHYPMRRSGTFAAALALAQNSPHIALEILGSLKQQSYVTIRNLKVGALADLNRPDDAIPILRAALRVDTSTDRKCTFSEEIIAKLKASIDKLESQELSQEFEKLERQLRATNSIISDPLDTQLCSQISAVAPPKFGQSTERQKRFTNTRQLRPGLEDMF